MKNKPILLCLTVIMAVSLVGVGLASASVSKSTVQSDQLGLSDSVTLTVHKHISLSESVGLADSVQATGHPFSVGNGQTLADGHS